MIMLEAFRRLGIADRKNLFFRAIDGKQMKNTSGMRAGNWGCALSKSTVMLQAAARKKPLFLLEDDVVIDPQIHSIMDACLAELPEDWKVLYLGCAALEPHKTMPTSKQPARDKTGQWYEVLANPNLNHALIIRDHQCLFELSRILADPETYARDEGRFTSDYTVAQYFAHKGIPMYGVTPAVAKQCTTYSDNEKKVIPRQATFNPIPKNALNRQWEITGSTKYPLEWGVEHLLPEDLKDKGYAAVKIHPPFDLTLSLAKPAEVCLTLLNTSRCKADETIRISVDEFATTLPCQSPQVFPLGSGSHRLTCNPEGEVWRWKHAALLIKEQHDH